VELYLHSPNTTPWSGASLKHRGEFICIIIHSFTDCVIFYEYRRYQKQNTLTTGVVSYVVLKVRVNKGKVVPVLN
jgi:hypothetical protein